MCSLWFTLSCHYRRSERPVVPISGGLYGVLAVSWLMPISVVSSIHYSKDTQPQDGKQVREDVQNKFELSIFCHQHERWHNPLSRIDEHHMKQVQVIPVMPLGFNRRKYKYLINPRCTEFVFRKHQNRHYIFFFISQHEEIFLSERQRPVYDAKSIPLPLKTRAPSQYKDHLFPVWGFSWDRLIFNMGIPRLVRRHLYIEMGPWWCKGPGHQQP